MTKSLWEVV